MRRTDRRCRKSKTFCRDYLDKNLIKYLSIGVISLLVLLLGVAIFYHIYHSISYQRFLESINNDTDLLSSNESSIEPEEKEETDTTFTMVAIGDIMSLQKTDDYDFSYIFEDIKQDIKIADISVGNLNTTFSSKDFGYTNPSKSNSPDMLAYYLKRLGVDVLSTASSHCFDAGFDGLCRTIDVLNNNDISHLGTYQTQEDRDKILFKYVKGIKIAFINYTYGITRNTIPSDQKFCVNTIDMDLMKTEIENAKSQEADMIVACMHWGTEYQATVSSQQKEVADFLFQNGVDIILGTHPHVLQPMEKRTVTLQDGTQKDGFVIYSLGDFMSDLKAESTRNSILLKLKITKHVDGKVTIDQINYVPIYKYKDPTSNEMNLLMIDKAIYNYEAGIDSSFGQKNYENFKNQLEKIESSLGT